MVCCHYWGEGGSLTFSSKIFFGDVYSHGHTGYISPLKNVLIWPILFVHVVFIVLSSDSSFPVLLALALLIALPAS